MKQDVENMEVEECLTVSVETAAKMLGISRGLAYEKAKTGELPSLRFGKRRVVPRRALERMLDECSAPKSLS